MPAAGGESPKLDESPTRSRSSGNAPLNFAQMARPGVRTCCRPGTAEPVCSLENRWQAGRSSTDKVLVDDASGVTWGSSGWSNDAGCIARRKAPTQAPRRSFAPHVPCTVPARLAINTFTVEASMAREARSSPKQPQIPTSSLAPAAAAGTVAQQPNRAAPSARRPVAVGQLLCVASHPPHGRMLDIHGRTRCWPRPFRYRRAIHQLAPSVLVHFLSLVDTRRAWQARSSLRVARPEADGVACPRAWVASEGQGSFHARLWSYLDPAPVSCTPRPRDGCLEASQD